MNKIWLLLASVLLLSISLASPEDPFAELDSGTEEIRRHCVNGQGRINIINGVKTVGCTVGFRQDSELSSSASSSETSSKDIESEIVKEKKKQAASKECPSSITKNRKEACLTYSTSMSMCMSLEESRSTCTSLAMYDATVSSAVKSLCNSVNKKSCVFHADKLISCYTAIKDLATCQNAADMMTSKHDEVLKRFPNKTDEAINKYKKCLTIKIDPDGCFKKASAYMAKFFPTDEGPCGDLLGKEQGYCGDSLYSRVKGDNANNISRHIKAKGVISNEIKALANPSESVDR